MTKGTTIFSYDQFSNLVSARESGFETIFRTTDTVGNLFETQDNSDRILWGGSRLEQSGIDLKEKRNKYQGRIWEACNQRQKNFSMMKKKNLAKKNRGRVEVHGRTFILETGCSKGGNPTRSRVLSGSNMMLWKKNRKGGNREKRESQRFPWNGNMPSMSGKKCVKLTGNSRKSRWSIKADFMQRLAEREAEKARQKAGQKQPENLITWVFQDDFIPRENSTRTGNYSIISDYLGTPGGSV